MPAEVFGFDLYLQDKYYMITIVGRHIMSLRERE